MAWELDRQRLKYAFEGRDDLISAIENASSAGPNWIELFNEVTRHVALLRDATTAAAAAATDTDIPAAKKRRIDIATEKGVNGKTKSNGAADAGSSTGEPGAVQLEINDISVVLPQRKKVVLAFSDTHIQGRSPQSKELMPGMQYAWADIAFVFRLPVPEKSQKNFNYVLFPTSRTIPPSKPSPETPNPPDPFIFTIPTTPPKPGAYSGPAASAAAAVGDEYVTLLDWAITNALQKAGKGVTIMRPDPKIFASVVKEPHRPQETAMHVKAFKGSKDGFLFFLEAGILFAFKKPVIFLPLQRISSVGYLAVLQRTFNLAIEVMTGEAGQPGAEDATEELEFAMLDQEDYDGINTYVHRYGLQDSSMAEQRKAKTLGINVIKNESGEVTGVAEAGELARAGLTEVEPGAANGAPADDDDEEDDDDFDPGSGGESEGEGDSSEDDDDSNDDDDGDDDGEEAGGSD